MIWVALAKTLDTFFKIFGLSGESEAISEQWKAIELIEECFSLELQIMRKNKTKMHYHTNKNNRTAHK